MKKLLIIIFCLLISGCNNYRELNNIAVVSALGIDYKDNMYNVSVLVKDNAKNDENKTSIYTYEGKSLDEAIILFIIIICTFGNLGVEMSALYRYPEYIVLKRISALNFIDNVENILFIIWIIIGFTSSTMSSLNIKRLYGNKVFYISIISLYLLISFWLIDSYKVIEFLAKYYLAILTSIMIILLLSKIKKN